MKIVFQIKHVFDSLKTESSDDSIWGQESLSEDSFLKAAEAFKIVFASIEEKDLGVVAKRLVRHSFSVGYFINDAGVMFPVSNIAGVKIMD